MQVLVCPPSTNSLSGLPAASGTGKESADELNLSLENKLQTSTVGRDFLAKLKAEPETLIGCRSGPDKEQALVGFSYLYTSRLEMWLEACSQFYGDKTKTHRSRSLPPVLREFPGGRELYMERVPDTPDRLDKDGKPHYASLMFNFKQSTLSVHSNMVSFRQAWNAHDRAVLQKMMQGMDGKGFNREDGHASKNKSKDKETTTARQEKVRAHLPSCTSKQVAM